MIKSITINKRLLDSGALLKKYQVIYEDGRVEVFKTPTPEINDFIQANRKDFTKVKFTFNG